MNPLVQFLLMLAGTAAFLAIISIIVFFADYNQSRSELRDLDRRIWALESGAQSVSVNGRDTWLEHTLLSQYLGHQESHLTRNVLYEKHRQYKSCIFDYARVPAVLGNRQKGVLVDFVSASFPCFAISRDRSFEKRHEASLMHYRLDMIGRVRDFPQDLIVLGDVADEGRVGAFIRQHIELLDLFAHPLWDSLYVRNNYVAVYFSTDELEYGQAEKQFYSVDEKIARLFLGDDLSTVDSTIEINLLKDQENDD